MGYKTLFFLMVDLTWNCPNVFFSFFLSEKDVCQYNSIADFSLVRS